MAVPAGDKLVPTVRRLALAFALSVAIVLPVGYFYVDYSKLIEHVETKAQVKAGAVSTLTSANPDLWMFQLQRMEELLLRYPVPIDDERAIVRDAAGNPLVTVGALPEAPVLVRSSPFYDSGRLLGQVEIAQSYRAVVSGTLFAGLLGLLLGVLVYATLLVLPLRALRRVTAALVQEQAALRESEARHQAVIESALDAIIVNDGRGLITEFNRAAEQTFGYRREDVVGKDLAQVLIPGGEGGIRRRRFKESLASGAPEFEGRRVEVPALHADGHEFPIELVVQRIDRGGQVFFTAFARDITVRERAKIAIEQAYRMRSEFMANVTHELRTPLNAVIGFAGLLKDEVPGPLNAQQAEFAADILASGQRLLELVEGILEMSRLDVAGGALEREPVEIGAVLEERMAAHRQVAGARGLTMRLEVAADTGSAELDPSALHRMLDALIDNAIKFNREGGTVAVSARRAGVALEIAVADTGIGIAREDLAKLFKPLAQLDAGLARRHGGVGLGLALARRLAELHGGTLEVESEPGKGSTFTLRLPILEKS
jgi:PAS domain S-box-containing protein